MDFEGFLRWEFSSRDTIDFKRVYVDMAGSVNAGLMLSEIVYWHLPSKEGNERLQVEHDGYKWIACRRYEWWDRTRLSPKESDTALSTLIEKGLVAKKLYKFQGEVTIHVRLDQKAFLSQLDYVMSHPVENPFSPKGKIQITQKVKSKSTKKENPYTESTSKTLTKKESVSSSDETLSSRKVLEAQHAVNPLPPEPISIEALKTNNPDAVLDEMVAQGYGDREQTPEVRAALDAKAKADADKHALLVAWNEDFDKLCAAIGEHISMGGAVAKSYAHMLRGTAQRKTKEADGGVYYANRLDPKVHRVWAVDFIAWITDWKRSHVNLDAISKPEKVSGGMAAWLDKRKSRTMQAQSPKGNTKLLDFMRGES